MQNSQQRRDLNNNASFLEHRTKGKQTDQKKSKQVSPEVEVCSPVQLRHRVLLLQVFRCYPICCCCLLMCAVFTPEREREREGNVIIKSLPIFSSSSNSSSIRFPFSLIFALVFLVHSTLASNVNEGNEWAGKGKEKESKHQSTVAQKCLKQHSINHHCHTNDCRSVLVSACQFGAADADATAKINRASTHAQTLAHT